MDLVDPPEEAFMLMVVYMYTMGIEISAVPNGGRGGGGSEGRRYCCSTHHKLHTDPGEYWNLHQTEEDSENTVSQVCICVVLIYCPI